MSSSWHSASPVARHQFRGLGRSSRCYARITVPRVITPVFPFSLAGFIPDVSHSLSPAPGCVRTRRGICIPLNVVNLSKRDVLRGIRRPRRTEFAVSSDCDPDKPAYLPHDFTEIDTAEKRRLYLAGDYASYGVCLTRVSTEKFLRNSLNWRLSHVARLYGLSST